MIIADRFDSPVGTEAERAGVEIPPGDWYNSNAYGNWYKLGQTPEGKPIMAFHTGADLLLWPGGGAHEPVYACASGWVRFAQRVSGSWGNVIVVQHMLPNGSEVYSRYGHVEAMLVKAGDEVQRGQQIASVGDAFGRFRFHLHFDISTTDRLFYFPADWPGLDIDRLRVDYIDPLRFIQEHRDMSEITLEQLQAVRAKALAVVGDVDALIAQVQPAPPPPTQTFPKTMYCNVLVANIRGGPSTSSLDIGDLRIGEAATVTGFEGEWARISAPKSGYVHGSLLSVTRPT